jgi:hypothetical protein
MASEDNGDGTLGFSFPLKILLLAGIGLILVGQLVGDTTEFAEAGDDIDTTEGWSNLLMNIGTLVGATALLLAGIMGSGSHTALRALLIFLGVALIFSGFGFGFTGGFGF